VGPSVEDIDIDDLLRRADELEKEEALKNQKLEHKNRSSLKTSNVFGGGQSNVFGGGQSNVFGGGQSNVFGGGQSTAFGGFSKEYNYRSRYVYLFVDLWICRFVCLKQI